MKKFAYMLIISAVILSFPACSNKNKGEELVPAGGRFEINVSRLEKGGARFFRHRFKDKNIVFMVARAGNGELKAAFDACITCYPHRMGYMSEKGCVICRYCDTSFSIENIDTGVGNCVPIKIPSRLEGENLVISQSDIEAGAKWF